MILLDFNIQLGKFVSYGTNGINWIDIIFRFITILVAIGIPILIYYLKDKADKRKEQNEKEDVYLNDLRYFSSVFHDILSDAKLQLEYYKELSEDMKVKPFEFIKIKITNTENLNRIINKFEHNRIFDAYLFKYKNEPHVDVVKRFVNIFKSFDFYLAQFSQSYKDVNKTHDFLRIHHKNYISASEVVRKQVENYKRSNMISPISLKFNSIKKDYLKQEVKNIEMNFTYFVSQIKEKIILSDPYQGNVELSNILDYCLEAELNYNIIKKRSLLVSSEFDETYKKIKVVIDKMEEFKNKYPF